MADVSHHTPTALPAGEEAWAHQSSTRAATRAACRSTALRARACDDATACRARVVGVCARRAAANCSVQLCAMHSSASSARTLRPSQKLCRADERGAGAEASSPPASLSLSLSSPRSFCFSFLWSRGVGPRWRGCRARDASPRRPWSEACAPCRPESTRPACAPPSPSLPLSPLSPLSPLHRGTC